MDYLSLKAQTIKTREYFTKLPQVYFKKILAAIFKLSFNAQINDLKFHYFFPGRILLFFGTSTSGKSSIVEQLAKQKTNLHFMLFSAYFKNFLVDKFFAFLFKDEVCVLRKYLNVKEIYELVECHVKYIPAGLTLNEIKLIQCKQDSLIKKREKIKDLYGLLNFDQLYHALIQAIRPSLQQGMTVIIDCRYAINILKQLSYELYHCEIIKILTYCPCDILASRLIIRNQEAIRNNDFMNARVNLAPFKEFLSYYKIAMNHDKIIDEVNIKKVTIPPKLLEQFNEILLTQGKEPINAIEVHQHNAEILQHFGLTRSRQVKITSTISHDIYLNTSQIPKTDIVPNVIEGSLKEMLKEHEITYYTPRHNVYLAKPL